MPSKYFVHILATTSLWNPNCVVAILRHASSATLRDGQCLAGLRRVPNSAEGDRCAWAMTKWWGALAIALAMILSGAASTMAEADGVSDFVETYQCSLAGLIAKILARDKRVERDRFIVLSLRGPTASYVQCAFGNRDREALCEAYSGWWNKPWEKPHFTAIQLRGLQGLGFSTDGSHGNFQKHMHFATYGPEPYALAELMLSALHDGYGARRDMAIDVVAPFALRHGFLPRQRCALIS
jgi:hypothetical protein